MEQYADDQDAVGGSDEYDIKLRIYDEEISRAEATYQSARGNVAKTAIYAPFSGTVLELDVKEGEVVNAGVPAIRLADLSNLEFEIVLGQEDIGLIKQGQQVDLTLDTYPNGKVKAYVSEIPLLANDSGDFTVKLVIDRDPQSALILGMAGDAYIVIESTQNEVQALEFGHLFRDAQGKYYVWVVNGNSKLKKEYVDVGLEGDLYTEVKTSLEGKTLVVPVENDGNKVEEGFIAKIIKQ